MTVAIHPTIACGFGSDGAAIAALRSLAQSGAVSNVRVGAADAGRAADVAREGGASATIDPTDPLAGVFGLASGADASAGVDRGAAIGGAAGLAAGLAAGVTSFGALIPVDPPFRPVASGLLFLAIGVAIGGVLGGAFGRRPSTHAGFRLIDAMEEGAIAVAASVASAHLEEARGLLERAGGTDVIVIDGSEAAEVSPAPS